MVLRFARCARVELCYDANVTQVFPSRLLIYKKVSLSDHLYPKIYFSTYSGRKGLYLTGKIMTEREWVTGGLLNRTSMITTVHMYSNVLFLSQLTINDDLHN